MNAETKRRVAACAAGFALPRYRDLPAVGLYLDQTVQYVNACFRTFCGVELTPSMVSNYVKKGILSHPVKKKYTREQIALPEPSPDATDERLLLRSTILSAANKIYLDCCFDALRQEQNLWADILPDLA